MPILLINFILITGICLVSLILIILISSKKDKLHRKILLLLFLLLFFILLNIFSYINQLHLIFKITYVIEDPSGFILGPLFFIYVKSLFFKEKGLIKKNFIHFIPSILWFLIIAVPEATISTFKDSSLFKTLLFLDDNSLIFITKAVIMIVYLIFSFLLFLNHRKTTKQFYSNNEKDLAWIKKFILVSLFLTFIHLVLNILDAVFQQIQFEDVSYSTGILIVFSFLYLGYHGIKQSKILLPDFLAQERNTFNLKKEGSHTNINLSSEELNQLNTLLHVFLTVEKVYLDPNLTLDVLAEKMGVTNKKLSYYINNNRKTNFYSLINEYRIKDVKEKLVLKEYDKYTFLGIANKSGFNSKTSFYRLFKEETGVSPSEYRKNN